VLGQVKDAMVAGNVFETLKHIIEMEDTCIRRTPVSSPPSCLKTYRSHERVANKAKVRLRLRRNLARSGRRDGRAGR